MKQNLISSLKKAFLILFIPAIQLLALRLYLHYGLKLRIGFRGTTDYDYILPVPTAFLLFVYCLDTAKPLVLKLQPRVLTFNLISVSLFLILNHFISTMPPHLAFPSAAWGTLLAAVILSSLCLWVSPQTYFRNPNFSTVLPALLIAFLFPVYMNSFEEIFRVFSLATTFMVKTIFTVFFRQSVDVSYSITDKVLSLKHSLLHLQIGKGCAGMESAFLFTFVYLAFLTVHHKILGVKKWILFYGVGIAMMFFTNIVRIVLLFWSGVGLRSWLSFEVATSIFKAIAHTHLGWVLYGVTGILYFRYLYLHSITRSNFESFKSEEMLPA